MIAVVIGSMANLVAPAASVSLTIPITVDTTARADAAAFVPAVTIDGSTALGGSA